MFFTLTAAIAGSLAAAAWLIQDGPAAATCAALAVGIASAAVAAFLVAQLDRRAPAAGPESETVADERPRLPRRRAVAPPARPAFCVAAPARRGGSHPPADPWNPTSGLRSQEPAQAAPVDARAKRGPETSACEKPACAESVVRLIPVSAPSPRNRHGGTGA